MNERSRGPWGDRPPFNQIQQAYAGYVFGDSTCDQRAIYQLGLTGIPVWNVNNNCSTGSSALMLGAQAIAGGLAECVIVVGSSRWRRAPCPPSGPTAPTRSTSSSTS